MTQIQDPPPYQHTPDSPSSRSTGSMVEILAPSSSSSLKYSKSHVYIHPTAYSRDNESGYAAIVEQQNPKKVLLSWIPDSMARARVDYESFVRADGSRAETDDSEYVLVEPIPERGESYAFSVPLSQVYSIIAYPPSLAKWYGSLTINLVGGQTQPTLHFHDDESPSTLSLLSAPRLAPSSSLTRPAASSDATWGGEELLQRLRPHCNLLRSVIEPNLFLVDPSRSDAEIHSTAMFDDGAVDDILSPVPLSRRPVPTSSSSSSSQPSTAYPPSSSATFPPAHLIHQPRASLLSTFSQITRAASSLGTSILSHPTIAPHLPQPVRSLIHADAPLFARSIDLTGTGEFESARVYLARWARLVAEEGEKAKRAEISGVEGARDLVSEVGGVRGDLGVWEVLRVTNGLEEEKSTREPERPIGKVEWEGWFDKKGYPTREEDWMRGEVFRRSVEADVRPLAWPYLLGVLPWKTSASERASLLRKKTEIYRNLRQSKTLSPSSRALPETVEEIHRIDVDCRRTDRSEPMFAAPEGEGANGEMECNSDDGSNNGKSASNEHVDKMAEILLTYGFFEGELGYVQGMSDLLSPLYVVFDGDEVMTFWSFVEWMERMKSNFLRDQSGMKQKLLNLQQLIAVMDPELYRHLGDLFRLFDHVLDVGNAEKTDGLNLFFCFRWILIDFKREFKFADIIVLWENIFTNHLTPHFILFIALAVLHSHRDVIIRYLAEFDEVLKYANDLSGCIDLSSTLAQAEVLYKSFQALVEDVDRRQAERHAAREAGLRNRGRRVGEASSTAGAASPAGVRRSSGVRAELDGLDVPNLPLISDNLRSLLG